MAGRTPRQGASQGGSIAGPTVTITERYGSLSALGIAKESTFGTAVTPTTFLPMTNATINPDFGLFSPGVMMGQKDLNIFRVYGEYKFNGALDGPLFPTNGVPILVASIGADGGRSGQATGYGVTGTTPGTQKVGTIAATIVGATTATYTPSSGGAPVVGDVFQFDTNVVGTSSAECRSLLTVTGTTSPYTITFAALNFAHSSGTTPAVSVVAPFTHTILQGNVLDSLTVEKNIGGYQSEQYVGCRVNQMDLKIAAGNTEAALTADIMAYDVNVLTTPSSVTVVDEAPFVFAEATLSLYGQSVYQAQSVNLSIKNGVKEVYALAGQHNPQFITPLTRAITGQIGVVFDSLNDANYGYFNTYLGQSTLTTTPGALSLTFTHPSGAGSGSLSISVPLTALSKYVDDIKMADVVMTTLDFTGFLNLGGTTVNSMSATVGSTQPSPY